MRWQSLGWLVTIGKVTTMRNDVEQEVAKHAVPTVVALMGALLGKMYSKEKETWYTVLRSMLAAVACSYLFVETYGDKVEASTVAIYVFIAAFLSDVIMQTLQILGSRIKEDPSLLTKFLPWSNKK